MMRGQVLNLSGQPKEGLAECLLAMRHNPHYPTWYLQGISRAYFMLGRQEDAIPFAERLVTAAPDMALGRLLLVANYAAAGHVEAARSEMSACSERYPELTTARVATGTILQKQADLERYMDLLRQAGLPDQ